MSEKPQVLIAVPTYGSGPYDSMIRFGMLCLQAGIDGEVIGVINSCMSYIHLARNALVKMARRCRPRPTHLMFIDQDSVPHPDTIHRLLSFNKRVIGAAYYHKRPPHMPIVFKFKPRFHHYDELPLNDSEPFRLIDGGIGMGATLIEMSVFDDMQKEFGDTMWYQCPSDIITGEDGKSEERFLGEDVFFCARLNMMGIEIWCDPKDQVEHIGSVGVTGETFRAYRSVHKESKAA